MNRLIVSDVQPDLLDLGPYNLRVEQICLLLVARHPDWIYLDEDILLDLTANVSKYRGRTFLSPDRLVRSRFHMRKVNTLTIHLFRMARKLDWSFVIVGPGADKLDLRIRGYIDSVEVFEE